MTVFWGVLTLIWLSAESANVLMVTLLGTGWAFALLGHLVVYRFHGHQFGWRLYLVASAGFGAVAGGLTAVMAVVLMVFKNVQHAHLTPDFPNETIINTFYRLPAWAIAGALLGAAYVFYLRATFVEPSEV